MFPLEGLRYAFEKKGLTFPEIRAMTRSGDTPQEERRRMIRHRPTRSTGACRSSSQTVESPAMLLKS